MVWDIERIIIIISHPCVRFKHDGRIKKRNDRKNNQLVLRLLPIEVGLHANAYTCRSPLAMGTIGVSVDSLIKLSNI